MKRYRALLSGCGVRMVTFYIINTDTVPGTQYVYAVSGATTQDIVTSNER